MTSEDRIPIDLREFVLRHFRSVAHLEAYLLLAENAQKLWSAEEISVHMRSNTDYAQFQMKELVAQGLIEMIEGEPLKYRLSSDKTLQAYLERLREAYSTHRPTIINLIYSRPNDSIMGLADAFIFGKKN